ncbi:hypothetical protein [Niallia taxi]|uniref:hypothetical protein n=1 Tax=Niallia taxi TaxID=2499688 RepID=UPI003D2A8F6F
MKKASVYIVLATMVLTIVACSNQTGETVEKSNLAATTSEQKDSSQETKNSTETKQEKTNHSIANQSNENNKPEEADTAIDVENYLNTHYALDNTHYIAESWKSEKTGKINYTVNILPNNKAYGQEINNLFKSGIPYEDDRTAAMFEIAERIMNELPDVSDTIHIDSVNWVSNLNDFQVMLIQDYENS